MKFARALFVLAPLYTGLSLMAPLALAVNYAPGLLTDRANANCGGGSSCSLREAIIAANNNINGPHTISLIAGTYELTLDGPGEDSSMTGDLDISRDITIIGADSSDASATVITGLSSAQQQLSDRIFQIRSNSGAIVTFQNLTIERGAVDADNGGAIFVGANTRLTLDNVIVKDSTTSNTGNINNVAVGGGIYNAGTLNLQNGTTIVNNHARVDQENQQASLGGGGLHNAVGANATITDTTFINNTSINAFVPANPASDFSNYSSGGGILNLGTLFMQDSFVGQESDDPGNPYKYANQSDSGAGISNVGGFLTINKSTISYNRTTTSTPSDELEGRTGGGIFNQNAGENRGSLLITATTVSFNQSTKIGGGIFNSGSPLTITHSTINNNESEFLGAGVHNIGSQAAEISNSTIAYNFTSAIATAINPTQGGGIYTTSRVNVNSVTIAGNYASEGAQIYIQDNSAADPRGLKPQITLSNTLIDHKPNQNTNAESNCAGFVEFITSLDYNLETGNSCNLNINSFNDQISTDPLLQTALADNLASTVAPPTKTIAFASSTSPAINARHLSGCPAVDQRYYIRGDSCDLGAFEEGAIEGSQTLADLKVTVTDSQDPAITERQLVYTITATNIGPDASPDVRMTLTMTQGMDGAVADMVRGVDNNTGVCSNNGDTIVCDLGTLPAFASRIMSVTLIPTTDTTNAANDLEATASVISTTDEASDYFRANNTVTESTEVQSINNCDKNIPGCPPFVSSPGGGGGFISPLSLTTLLTWFAFFGLRKLTRLRSHI